jgi:vancomycin resistance protein YoaR
VRRGRTPRVRRRVLVRRVVAVALLVALSGIVLGLAFAGSPTRLPAGVRIAGVDVGGLTPSAAQSLLERKASALEHTPVTFRAAGHAWRFTPSQLGVRVSWHDAVESARQEGAGFGPLRGFKRLDVRVFGADVTPQIQVFNTALEYVLGKIAGTVDVQHRDASIGLRRLRPVVVPAATGRRLNRGEAATTIVQALASLTRAPVTLPVRLDLPKVRANDLVVIAAEVKTALSAPVRLSLGQTSWRIYPRRIAQLLELPANGRRDLRIGGPGANRWFAGLASHVNRPPVDASWAISSRGIRVIPDRPGYTLDVGRSAKAFLRAILVTDPSLRAASLVASTQQADRTTKDAQNMHIQGLVSSYQTFYGGDPNRIHNVQLVAHLIDGHAIAPGSTFSFNQATGARTAAKGFKEAPVIINGELQTGLGGGVCQVSTTVFNAGYEAGLPITARTNHALYISHYPQGRDATVNYPDVDLKFVNDTGHWLLLRTWVGRSSLAVALYGTPVHRRVVSDVAPLVETDPPPVREVPNADLVQGERVVEDSGEPSRTTNVRRRVYSADGKLLGDTVFYSSYRSEPEIVEVGTKPKPRPPKPKPPPKKKPATTTSTTTSTTTTTTKTTTTPQP